MFSHIKEFFTRPSGYNINRSVRLRSSASAYLNRTFSSGTSVQKGTQSFWVKRGVLSTLMNVGVCAEAASYPANGAYNTILFTSSDTLNVQCWNGSSYDINLITTQVFRDPSAWYHIVVSWDTTQATSSNRAIVYVNGVQVTSYSTATYPSQNTNLTGWGASNNYTIGTDKNNSNVFVRFFDGYLTEINFIDGQALTPSSFGQTNSVTGVWQPIKYTGTYGTNGFYLNFSDNSSNTATTIGKDYSGNGNNWTPNNISVTAGATYDSMLDVPTPYADGGNGRGNYCVLNPLDKNANLTISNGNLTFQASSATAQGCRSSFAIPSGIKVYAECLFTTWTTGTNNYAQFGIATSTASLSSDIGNTAGTGFTVEANQLTDTPLRLNGTSVVVTGAVASGDVFQVAVDYDNLKVWLGKNNTWYDSAGGTTGNPATGANATGTLTSGTTYFPAALKFGTANSHAANFGQRPFTYTPPSGFVALNTQNLPTPTITNGATVMAASTYTGTGATQTIANSGNNAGAISFKPDLVWIKSRSAATNNNLFDSVRGTTDYLISNSTAAAATNANTLTAFGTTGFTLGSDASALGVNVNTATYVGWQWQAGQGSSSSNTNGSITSTVSVNATAGFSIQTWTAQTSGSGTIGHGLGVAPKMVITKARGSAGTNWYVYTETIGANGWLLLNSTAAAVTGNSAAFGASPTSTVFTNGSGLINQGTCVSYCWSEVAGFSKFGSYTGNGSSDGPFVYTGFRPKFLLIKNASASGGWVMLDTSRDPYNIVGNYLYAYSSAAEAGSSNVLDILSNGFKVRNSWTDITGSGNTIVYAAFAENPFKNALAR